jgi:hypothetical protein
VHGEEPDVPALDEVLEENVEGRSVEGAYRSFLGREKKGEKTTRFPEKDRDPNRRFGTSAKRE